MKIKIELDDWEVRNAIARMVNDKMGFTENSEKLWAKDILLNGSVKYKNKSVRKEVKRMIASAMVTK